MLVQVRRMQQDNLLFKRRQVHGREDISCREQHSPNFFDARIPLVVNLRQNGVIFPGQRLTQKENIDHFFH